MAANKECRKHLRKMAEDLEEMIWMISDEGDALGHCYRSEEQVRERLVTAARNFLLAEQERKEVG